MIASTFGRMNSRISLSLLALLVLVTPASADQVILDDLIVDGSACIGMDCVNGESFGFDTIRIKENNLRIRAVDTSSTSSFPSRDWQITFNDSSNGGQNKFSIDDIDGGRTPFTIEAGAPSHSLYVDDGGRIGFGTSTPVADLHVKSGNTPTLRLEQDGTSGFTPQTFDAAGNEANFFIRDATNGSTLPFRIRPGAGSSSIDIEDDGSVRLNSSSSTDAQLLVNKDAESSTAEELVRFRVADSSNEFIRFENASSSDSVLIPRITGTSGGQRTAMSFNGEIETDAGSNPALLFRGARGSNDLVTRPIAEFHNRGTVAVSIAANGDITANSTLLTSTREAKKDIRVIDSDEAQLALEKLQPVEFIYKKDATSEKRVGFIAEDVPDLVAVQGRKTVSPIDIVGVLTKVVKDQQETISDLNKRIEALEGEK